MMRPAAMAPEPALLHAACPVCDAAQDRVLLSLDFLAGVPAGMNLVRCRGCGTERIDPHLSPRCMADHYDDSYYQDGYLPFLARRRADFARRVLELERLAPVLHARRQGRPPRVLDIGAGVGLFVAEARARGWQASGVEPSAAARRMAARTCSVDLASDWPSARQDLDLVTFWDVLGHVDDPRAALEQARRAVRPGGEVILKIPNFQSSWQRMLGWMSVRRRVNMLHVPTVIWRFHRHGARHLLDQCGFSLQGVRTVREPDLIPLTPRWRLVRRVTALLDAVTDNRQEMILHARAR